MRIGYRKNGPQHMMMLVLSSSMMLVLSSYLFKAFSEVNMSLIWINFVILYSSSFVFHTQSTLLYCAEPNNESPLNTFAASIWSNQEGNACDSY